MDIRLFLNNWVVFFLAFFILLSSVRAELTRREVFDKIAEAVETIRNGRAAAERGVAIVEAIDSILVVNDSHNLRNSYIDYLADRYGAGGSAHGHFPSAAEFRALSILHASVRRAEGGFLFGTVLDNVPGLSGKLGYGDIANALLTGFEDSGFVERLDESILRVNRAVRFNGSTDAPVAYTLDNAKLIEAMGMLSDARSATEVARRQDPLIFDLGEPGIPISSLAEGVYFDHDSNSFLERSAWVNDEDGLLVLDLDGNGVIESGRELFGCNTQLRNGEAFASGAFQALADWDDNADGVIDSADEVWSALRVWIDEDRDGFSDSLELKPLAELGIASIPLDFIEVSVVGDTGSELRQKGEFVRLDGERGVLNGFALVNDRVDTVYILTDENDNPEEEEGLRLSGAGNVPDLEHAMNLDTTGELRLAVDQLFTLLDYQDRYEAIEGLIFKWTGVEDVERDSRGGTVDARRLAALEALQGDEWVGVSGADPNASASRIINQAFDELKDYVYFSLLFQSDIRDILSLVYLDYDTPSESWVFNYELLASIVSASFESGALSAADLIDLIMLFRFYDPNGNWKDVLAVEDAILYYFTDILFYQVATSAELSIVGKAITDAVIGNGQDNELHGASGDDVLYGGAGADVLFSGGGSDLLMGGEGNDELRVEQSGGDNQLQGEEGDDHLVIVRSSGTGAGNQASLMSNLLEGGPGNDRLEGWVGAETYYFELDDGQDVIADMDNGPKRVYQYGRYYYSNSSFDKVDRLIFGEGLSAEYTEVNRVGADLVLSLADTDGTLTGDKVTIEKWYERIPENQIERIEFLGGVSITNQDINNANYVDVNIPEGLPVGIAVGH